MGKVCFYGPIQGELGVIMAFTKMHEELGFSRLVPSSSRGFDIDSIDYNGQTVTLEFEYLSSNFITHGHPDNMTRGNKYVVICWEDDCGLMSVLADQYGKQLFDLIELRKHVAILSEASEDDQADEPKYAILVYNPKTAGGKDFGEWTFSHCYRVKTTESHHLFADDELPPGSKILFYQNGFIIGGFTVVRYEVIGEPRNNREWLLYKKLTDYPCSLFVDSIEDLKKGFLQGHIFYIDFFDIRDFKVPLSHYVDKPMSRHGKINITREEYYRIRGY